MLEPCEQKEAFALRAVILDSTPILKDLCRMSSPNSLPFLHCPLSNKGYYGHKTLEKYTFSIPLRLLEYFQPSCIIASEVKSFYTKL